MKTLMLNSLSSPDMGLLLMRLTLGWFFILARFRWFYDPSRPEEPWFNGARHSHLVWKLCSCGYGKHHLLVAFVATVEVFAGCGVVSGLLTVPALMGLLCILLGATYCTAHDKVCEQHPSDCIDVVSCYLWRVEGVYIAITIMLLLSGPGKFSLDYLVFG